jgi:hypothetical protein
MKLNMTGHAKSNDGHARANYEHVRANDGNAEPNELSHLDATLVLQLKDQL